MLTESKCTVYKYNKQGGFDKAIIPECHYQECRASSTVKSGMQGEDGAVILIPGKYACNAPETAAKDMIVRGECSFCFNNATPESISRSFKEFKEKYDFVTVMSIDRKLYGMKTDHVKVSCK